SNPIEDLAKWQDGRLMQHYHRVKPWIALIINHLSPLTQAGATAGVSMLFPMEKLFEKYVFKVLKERIKNGYSLRAQPSAGWLSHHRGEERFNLKPDLLLQKGQERICIMDTKWKLLDETATDRNYDLSQSDIYQLYAYGQKCLPDGGDLFLIYPRHKKFQKPLQPFHFGSTHTLWAVPFCLETDELLIAGDLKIVGYSPAITHTPQTAQ
ncbi:MAG TPA: restriction endonuclease, partial [Alphaproteobacteria bacterium]|nr:restriction endonuclease [Alphaproteobacteria bacterium]